MCISLLIIITRICYVYIIVSNIFLGPGIIDLTSENPEADLQKAIAASLCETNSTGVATGILGGQVSREEQDISRLAMIFLRISFWLIQSIWTY